MTLADLDCAFAIPGSIPGTAYGACGTIQAHFGTQDLKLPLSITGCSPKLSPPSNMTDLHYLRWPALKSQAALIDPLLFHPFPTCTLPFSPFCPLPFSPLPNPLLSSSLSSSPFEEFTLSPLLLKSSLSPFLLLNSLSFSHPSLLRE